MATAFMLDKIGETLWVVMPPEDKGHDVRIKLRPYNKRFKYLVYCDQMHLNSWASLDAAKKHVTQLLETLNPL